MNTKLSFLIGILFLIFGGQSLSYAQLVVDKGKIQLIVKPGEKITNTMNITNNGDTELKVKVYTEDFIYSAPFEGTKEFFTAGTQKDSNANWITVAPREVVLPPKGQKEIAYVINVPKDTQGGSQGVIIFENLPVTISQNPFLNKNQQKAGAGLSFILRVGTLVFLQAEDTVIKPIVDKFSFEGSILKFNFQNEGQAVLITETKYYVMDADGNVADRGDAQKKYLPMGQTTDLGLVLPEDMPAGEYTLVLSMDLGGYDTLVREVDFRKNSSGTMEITAVRE